jgi:hypothetical protein
MAEQQRVWDEPATERPDAGGVLTFVLCMLLLVGGFALMMVSFDQGWGPVFLGAIVVSGLGFMIPLLSRR